MNRYLAPLIFITLSSCTQPRGWYRTDGLKPIARLSLSVANPLTARRSEVPVVIKRSELPSFFQKSLHLVVVDPYAGEESNGQHMGMRLPSQMDDLNGDGEWDELAFQVDLEDLQVKALHLYSSLSSVPVSVKGTDVTISSTHHITQLVMESDKITYAVSEAASLDVIGKLSPGFNIDYYFGKRKRSPNRERNSEHGLDFLPVGTTFGAASFCVFEEPGTGKYARPWSANSLFFSESDLPGGGAKYDFKILKKGPVRAIGEARVTNWKSDKGEYAATCRYVLWAKSQSIECEVVLTQVPASLKNYRVGIGFREAPNETSFKATPNFACATAKDIYSVASGGIIADQIGLGLVYSDTDFDKAELSKDEQKNHLILFKAPNARTIRYHAVAGWNRDETVQSPEQWEDFVSKVHQELSRPPVVRIGAEEF